MRHVRDLDPCRRDARIGIVGHDVAAADLDGIEPDRLRRPIHQRSPTELPMGMSDSAILGRWYLVEIDHGGLAAVVLVLVGSAGDVEDLIGLEHAGARELRIGAGARKHVDVERLDLAGPADPHACAYAFSRA